jgi:flagellar biosynthetic protein FliS
MTLNPYRIHELMTTTAYQKAVSSYQKQNDENLTPLQIVVELYKGMMKNVLQAKACWQRQELDTMTNIIVKTFDIIEALQSNLDFEQGGEDAKVLNHFYNVTFSALTMATAKPDPAEEFDGIYNYIKIMHDKWYFLAYGKPVPEGDASAQPPVSTSAMISEAEIMS